MKNNSSQNNSMFKINNDLYPEFLIDIFKRINRGSLISNSLEINSLLPNYLKKTHPDLIDYSNSKPLNASCLAKAIVHSYSISNDVLKIKEVSPYGISLNQVILNNLICCKSKTEQFTSLLKLSSFIFHEIKHIDDFTQAKKENSSFAHTFIMSHLASLCNGNNFYYNTYTKNFVENNAYYHQYLSEINLAETLLNSEWISRDIAESLKIYLEKTKIKLYETYLNELSPIELNGNYLSKNVVNAKILKPIIKASPHLLNQFGVLNLKYTPSGEEKDLITLLNDRATQLLSSDQSEHENINNLYAQLIFEKLALSKNKEIIDFLKNSSPNNVQTIIDLSSSFVFTEINKERTLLRNCSNALFNIIQDHPNQTSAINAYDKAQTAKKQCYDAHSEMISVVENFKALATTNSNIIGCNQNTM